jgi:hypothetical protein
VITEDLNLFLEDFGVTCTAGAVTAKGILDMPSQVVADGMVLTTDYTLTCRAVDFGTLIYGDGITVAGVAYQVRETRLIDDGQMCEVSLSKLATGQLAPGGQPNAKQEFGLGDLADVELTSAQSGDLLVNNGTAWVDASTIDEGSY